ncbi:MAG: penicillin-binding protein 2, partial [Desulfobacterales bacterium]|nr:penicillin-binding protein 2 [Desulfobacterales bacterium]
QMAMLTAAVANGGSVYKPRIMRCVESVQGRTVQTGESGVQTRLPASQETLEIIRKGLYDVVNHRKGTAYWYVRSKEIPISGKTGTAEVISRKAGQEEADQGDQYLPHAWFVGYAPSDRPEIAVSVFIEHGEHGSSGAGPLAKEMMLSYLTSRNDPEAQTPLLHPNSE